MSDDADEDELYTLADLVDYLGVTDLNRIWFQPCPGSATPDDVQTWRRYYGRPFELVASTLVEKPLEHFELCMAIGRALDAFVRPANLGVVCWGLGPFRLNDVTVRVPAAAFVSWERLPGGKIPTEPVAAIVPDLVVELITPTQSAEERARRREDYLAAGVRLLCEIDPESARAITYTTEGPGPQAADWTGGAVLPGFMASVPTLVAAAQVDSAALTP